VSARGGGVRILTDSLMTDAVLALLAGDTRTAAAR
jgi:hypothetical protein